MGDKRVFIITVEEAQAFDRKLEELSRDYWFLVHKRAMLIPDTQDADEYDGLNGAFSQRRSDLINALYERPPPKYDKDESPL